MKNTKGLSAIVTTLIIILLVIVAVGIIWVVVRNVVQSGAEQIDINTKCVAVDLSAVSVNESSAGVYDVTLFRAAGGDEIGGVKIVIFNSTANSGVLEFGEAIDKLQTVTQAINTSGAVTNGNKIEYTVYFLDASENEQLCTQTNEFTF
jgi:uncharacterized membrane protein YqiK